MFVMTEEGCKKIKGGSQRSNESSSTNSIGIVLKTDSNDSADQEEKIDNTIINE